MVCLPTRLCGSNNIYGRTYCLQMGQVVILISNLGIESQINMN